MYLRIAILFTLAVAAFGANSRLYLKDGDYQLVREYQVLADRVRYFSTERGDWEEIPIELVDLERTKKDAAERQAAVETEAKEQDVEDKAIRAEKKEAAQVPLEPGVYYVVPDKADKIESLKLAEVAVNSSKGRSVLKVLAPIPIVPGKSTVEIKGESAAYRKLTLRNVISPRTWVSSAAPAWSGMSGSICIISKNRSKPVLPSW